MFDLQEYLERDLDQDDVETELCERKLRHFVRNAWKTVDPDPFCGGWHIDAVCEHLEAVTLGQIRNLIINIPPRHTKSLVTSVMWPAWEWGPKRKPGVQWMFASHAQQLSTRDSVKCRLVIQSPWYQARWGHVYYLMGDQNEKTRYNTNAGGYRLASSVEGMATGEGGGRIVVDDPHNISKIESVASREFVLNWWDHSMSTRLNNPETGAKVIIMQRSHAGDLVGHILEKKNHGYELLILPAEFVPSKRCTTSIGFRDPRKKEGALLWKERFPKSEVDKLKNELGTYAASAQLQQSPAPMEGGVIKRHWFSYYQTSPALMALEMDFIIQSWDMSFKNLSDSDYVAGGVFGVKSADIYLLDLVRERLSFTQTLKAVKAMTSKWPDAEAKYVEDKANGTAVIDTLRSTISGIIPFSPTESKESRVFAISPVIEAGNLYLPNEREVPWVKEYISEMCVFNKGAHDDQVDMTSQAIIMIKKLRARHSSFAPVESVTKSSDFVRGPHNDLIGSRWHPDNR